MEIVKISVRNLVEFMMREGDINTSTTGVMDMDALQLGSKIHRKIQKRMGPEYQAEVSLFALHDMEDFQLKVEGRADGIIRKNPVIIDEIKSTYQDIYAMEKPALVHEAQAKCYAYMVADKESLPQISVQLTYVNIETERERRFLKTYTFPEIEGWYLKLIEDYAKWAQYEYHWKLRRNQSIQLIEFPFDYREGQKDLVVGAYRTILRSKKLFLEAPTGVGKTISTVFPAVKAIGEGLSSRIFYLTAKTITRTVAEDCFQMLGNQGLDFKTVTITAKDKICIFDKAACNPTDCPRAKGHYDRINNALFDLLTNNEKIDRQIISEYSEKYKVCPYEMSLDVALFSDAVICDYNYVFDPNVYLKRFFAGEKKGDMIFLIDEAHNLVERGREMYSATLNKEDFLLAKRFAKARAEAEKDSEREYETRGFIKCLESGNKQMLEWKHECDDFSTLESVGMFEFQLLRLLGHFDTFLKNYPVFDDRDKVLNFYFDLRHFLNILDLLSEKYTIYTDYDEQNRFRVKLQCMDPSDSLSSVLSKGRSAIFFSATLLPVRYYMEQLGGKEGDYAVYAPSSFPKENRGIFIAQDVSTKYTRRNESEFEKVCNYLKIFVGAKTGNYLVFFPSYAYMEQIYKQFENDFTDELIMQEKSMSEQEKEDFLKRFTQSNSDKTLVGFCVLGGIFSEGIDLTEDKLIGAAIVGTGLPMVCNERELFMKYYQQTKGKGFDYAYLYQGMNKVLQSGGRVIRTVEDRGVILLLDERFLQKSYLNLFPKEWSPYCVVDQEKLKSDLSDFWKL